MGRGLGLAPSPPNKLQGVAFFYKVAVAVVNLSNGSFLPPQSVRFVGSAQEGALTTKAP